MSAPRGANPPPDPPRRSRGRRIGKAFLALAIGFALALLLVELGFRFLVLGDSALARRLGADLRKPEYFADSNHDDDYWKLQYLFLPDDKKGPAPGPDPEVGWTAGRVRPRTYEHVRAAEVGSRRPVLLFGDSYSACTTEPRDCFEEILERSDLADRYMLLNYGVGGYGLDQVYLLMRRSLDAWKDRDPIVVVGFLADNDLDRNVLTFRCWPKPRFALDGERLVDAEPVLTDPEAFLDENPPSIQSYLLRYLAYRPGVLPPRWQWYLRRGSLKNEEKVALGRKLLESIHAELESRGIEHFFLSFHGEAGLARTEGVRWVDELVERTAADLGVPLVTTRPYLLAAAKGDVEQARRYFGGSPRLFGHYNPMGNLIAFEALRAGLEGRFGEPDPGALEAALARIPMLEAPGDVLTAVLGCTARVRAGGAGGLVREGRAGYPPFDPASTEPYLVLRPGANGPAELLLDVAGKQRRLRGRAIGVRGPGALVLRGRVDGMEVLRVEVPFHPDGLDLDVPLEGAAHLELIVERAGPGESWVHVAGIRLESPP